MAKAKVEIIYSDDDIVVVNKPSGVSVTKDRSGKEQLLDVLSRQMSADEVDSLRLIHRLDKATSGCLMLARTPQAQSKYSSCFEKQLIRKTYLALVTGFPIRKSGNINARIIKDSKRPGQMHLTRKHGKGASTKWQVLADFNGVCLLAVWPLTGRTHQIRVHLPSVGLPLAIDPLYGNKRPIYLSDFKQDYRLGKGQKEKPLMERLTLHAYQLELKEPQAEKPDCFVAPLDKKLRQR